MIADFRFSRGVLQPNPPRKARDDCNNFSVPDDALSIVWYILAPNGLRR
jgi:hypothetical protein